MSFLRPSSIDTLTHASSRPYVFLPQSRVMRSYWTNLISLMKIYNLKINILHIGLSLMSFSYIGIVTFKFLITILKLIVLFKSLSPL
jgi:hypothetical protein